MNTLQVMRLKGLRANIVRYLNLPAGDKRLFREAFFLHIRIWLLLLVVPFKKIPGLFEGPGNESDVSCSQELEKIRAAVIRASGVFPFRNRCLVSSLAARKMLTRRNIKSKISFGVSKIPGGKFSAHAWIDSDGFEIVEQSGDYKVIFFF